MRIAALFVALFTVAMTSVLASWIHAPGATCIYADGSSNPGDTKIHAGACQQCGTDGQWFDVQGVKCPGCTDSQLNQNPSPSIHNESAVVPRRAPENGFCTDGAGRTYSIGALLFNSKCLRCDTHGTFSQDNEENCKVCKVQKSKR
jgi:hypothetical protein